MDIKKIYSKNKGLYQFAIRAAIFAAILFGVYFFVFLYFRHTPFFRRFLVLPDDFYLPFLTGLRKADFINAGLFTAVLYFIWNRETFMNLKPYKQDWKQTFIFSSLAILSQVLHYGLKYIVKANISEVFGLTPALAAVKYIFNIAFAVFLALAVFNIPFFRKNIKPIHVPVFGAILVSYFFLIQFFQRIWVLLGTFVAYSEYFLLRFTFGSAMVSTTDGIKLGAKDFIVGISAECSGIDSLLLFLSIYTVLFALDYKRMHVKRMAILLIPGVIGAVVYNLLRVYLLMLVGILISPRFALDMFHSNIGWILFLLFFIAFWHFGSEWVYKKQHK